MDVPKSNSISQRDSILADQLVSSDLNDKLSHFEENLFIYYTNNGCVFYHLLTYYFASL